MKTSLRINSENKAKREEVTGPEKSRCWKKQVPYALQTLTSLATTIQLCLPSTQLIAKRGRH